MAFIVAAATVVSTFLGGLFAIRFKDKLHLILGFSAGAVIGVAFFDLLPESIAMARSTYEIGFVTSIIALGFVAYMILDRFFSLHVHTDHHEENCANESHNSKLGAGALIFHSFLDGISVGLAFQVSSAVGWIVAAAVLAHNFSDGINTVGLILRDKGNKKQAIRWLVFDALAPALGVLATLFFSVPEAQLGLILALFTGSFLYIGASDLIPESHHHHPTFQTTLMTVLGIAILYLVIRLAS